MLSNAKRSAGFTLIELLVVIGILGILAAALVATIDPFEQLKKANDANVENAEIELINATIRYYTIHGGFPWDSAGSTGNGGTNCAGINALPADTNDLTTPLTLNSATFTPCLQDLVDNGELKASYMGATGILGKISIFERSAAVTTCYDPESKSKTQDKETKYTSVANAAAATPVADTTTCVGTGTAGTNIVTTCFKCTSG